MHKSVEEFSVKTLEVGGLCAVVQALRLPFGGECKSEPHSKASASKLESIFKDDKERPWFYVSTSTATVCPEDVALISTLVKRGDEHAKVLRGMTALAEINAPRYFWQEMDRYRIGCECLSSESTMHIEGKGLDEDALVDMKEHLEEGHMQKRVWMFSYQTLRRIYFQRKNHRLPQWRKFCEWIKTLPFADEFITVE